MVEFITDQFDYYTDAIQPLETKQVKHADQIKFRTESALAFLEQQNPQTLQHIYSNLERLIRTWHVYAGGQNQIGQPADVIQIARYSAAGYTAKDIGNQLGVSKDVVNYSFLRVKEFLFHAVQDTELADIEVFKTIQTTPEVNRIAHISRKLEEIPYMLDGLYKSNSEFSTLADYNPHMIAYIRFLANNGNPRKLTSDLKVSMSPSRLVNLRHGYIPPLIGEGISYRKACYPDIEAITVGHILYQNEQQWLLNNNFRKAGMSILNNTNLPSDPTDFTLIRNFLRLLPVMEACWIKDHKYLKRKHLELSEIFHHFPLTYDQIERTDNISQLIMSEIDLYDYLADSGNEVSILPIAVEQMLHTLIEDRHLDKIVGRLSQSDTGVFEGAVTRSKVKYLKAILAKGVDFTISCFLYPNRLGHKTNADKLTTLFMRRRQTECNRIIEIISDQVQNNL